MEHRTFVKGLILFFVTWEPKDRDKFYGDYKEEIEIMLIWSVQREQSAKKVDRGPFRTIG